MLLQRLHEVIDDPEGGCSDMRALSVQNGWVSLRCTSPVPRMIIFIQKSIPEHTRAYQSVPELWLLRVDSVKYEEMRQHVILLLLTSVLVSTYDLMILFYLRGDCFGTLSRYVASS